MRTGRPDFLSRHIVLILIILVMLGILLSVVAIIIYSAHFPGPLPLDYALWGAVGDFFGGVLNPIFSFLAFIALLITIILQNQELSLSRDELTKSAEALIDQSKAANLQNFENTFFQMVHLHNDIVNSMSISDPDDANTGIVGRHCFLEYYQYFLSHFDKAKQECDGKDPLAIVDKGFDSFLIENQASVGHYFRNLFTLVDFVDKSTIENKKHYTNMIRAQLSSYELALLFYNCLWRIGRMKFKALVEKHALMTNLDASLLTDAEGQIPLYEDSAYGDLEIREKFLNRNIGKA
ncbi:hypothetical protein MNBD_NITROSPINAE02-471 [hydrothermal vent metagenome]|uniref:Phage abortive infection protein n=1 Tax=hydrothermal vent metagenome TaxID=652676 RepID=A0A3B1C8L2_9ZZZZ